MFLKRTVIIVAGLIFGGATAAGVIALLTTLGFVSRMIARLQLAKDTMHWENVIILGSLSGCLLSVFEPSPVLFSFCQGVAGRVFAKGLGLLALVLIGICAGIYVGCQGNGAGRDLKYVSHTLSQGKTANGAVFCHPCHCSGKAGRQPLVFYFFICKFIKMR